MKRNVKPLYWLGLLGIIPFVGAFVGITLMLFGIFKFRDKGLVLIGLLGLIFTIGVYSFLYYEVKYGNVAGKDFAEISQKDLNNLAYEIESYKLHFGKYPDDLEELKRANSNIDITDPLLLRKANSSKPYFLYVNRGSQYSLYSVGMDGIPNTKDDIYPNVKDSIHYGFVKP